MSGNYKKLGKNTLVLTIGSFSSKILNYLLIPVYTYALSTDEYGVVDLLLTTVTLLVPVLTMSFSEAILRFSLDSQYDKSVIFSGAMGMGIFSCGIFALISPVLRLSGIIEEYYGLFFLMFVTNVYAGILGQFAKGCENVRIYTLAGIVQTVVFLCGNIYSLLLLKSGVAGYLSSNIIANLSSIAIIWVSLKLHKYLSVLTRNDIAVIKEMIAYSLPLIPNNISWWINNSLDKYILAMYFGAELVGLYSTSYKIPSIMQTFVTIFWSAWQISAVEDFGTEKSRQFFETVYRSLNSCLVLICGFIIIASEFLATIAFQKDFFEAWRYAPVLILSFLFSGLSSFLGTIYTSAKKTNNVLVSTCIGALINLVLNLFLIPMWGAYGAAIATLVSYFSIWIYRIIDSGKLLKMSIGLEKEVYNYALLGLMAVLILALPGYCLRYTCLALLYCIICFRKKDFLQLLLHKLQKLFTKVRH